MGRYAKYTRSIVDLTFVNLNGDSRLVVRSRGKDLGLLCGDHSVSGDQLGHYSSDSLNTKGQRADVQKDNITCKTGKDDVNIEF